MGEMINDTLQYQGLRQDSPIQSAILGDSGGDSQPRIVIVGVGGAGNNIVSRLNLSHFKGGTTCAIDTDKRHLHQTVTNRRLLIRPMVKGLGSLYPEHGRQGAEQAQGALEDALKGIDLCFVIAGMGGGTGTGAAPVVAQIAKDQGALTVGIVTYPLRIEGARVERAELGLAALRRSADNVLVLHHEWLRSSLPECTLGELYTTMDHVIAETVAGVCEAIYGPCLSNLGLHEVSAILHRPGPSTVCVSSGRCDDDPLCLTRGCLTRPLLDADPRTAGGCLVLMTGGLDLALEKAETIATSIGRELDPRADLFWSARLKSGLEGTLRLHAVCTGLGEYS